MPLRDAILAVLTLGDCHGSRISAELTARTGAKVNAGQVAKTLARLAADGLVSVRPRDPQGRIPYSLTDAGRREAQEWLVGTAIDVERLRLIASLPGTDRTALLDAHEKALARVIGEAAPATALATPPRRGRPLRGD